MTKPAPIQQAISLFHVREEGEAIRQGINVWPRGDPYSTGFILRAGPLILWFRWSKVRHRLHLAAHA